MEIARLIFLWFLLFSGGFTLGFIFAAILANSGDPRE